MAEIIDLESFEVEKKTRCTAACKLLNKTHAEAAMWAKFRQPICKEKLIVQSEDELVLLQAFRQKLARENEIIRLKVNKQFANKLK